MPLAALFALALAAEPPVAFTNATLYTAAADQPLRGATLVVRAGKITAVGEKLPPPAGARAVDLAGAVVIPGLVDTHSHVGVYGRPGVAANSDGNEMSGPVQPAARAVDALWPGDPGVRMANAGGVTVANVMPGSGNVIGGQTVYVKMRGDTAEAMRLTGQLPDGTEVLGGLKMANGENPKGYGRSKGAAPFTRMKVASLQREQFQKAREYQAKWKTYNAGDKKGAPPERDLALEPLVEVLERRRTVHFHCHRADDLVTAVRISEEFGFELVLQHATEAYRVAPLLAKKRIPVSLTLLDAPGGKAETIGLLEENASFLDGAGVPVAVNTDDSVTESRFLLRTAATAVRGGLSEAAALRAVTLTAAKLLHFDHRVGSLEVGKDADFAVLSGPPFALHTKVVQTWIDGEKVFDAADPAQRPYRDGGWMLPRGTPVPEAPAAAPAPKADAPGGQPQGDPSMAKVVAVRAGRVHTVSGPPINDGVVLMENGKITAVGPAADVKIPDGAAVLMARECTPGLVNAFGTVGLSGAWNVSSDQDQDEVSDPNGAEMRVLDGYNPREPLLEFARAGGVTVQHTAPGRACVLAGTSGVFRAAGATAEEAALRPVFAPLVNLGELPKEASKAKGPGTRMGVAALVRKAFAEAQGYAAKRKAEPDKTPKNPKHEALLPALEGKVPVFFAAHRADDVRTALRVADEFALKPVLALGTEAFLLSDELARRKVPVVVHPAMQRSGGSMETANTLLATAALLKAKGVPVALGTAFEGYVPKSRDLRAEAAMAAANGLGQAGALRAVTLDAAALLGVETDHGSLEVGKAADVVLYDGDPFEHATHVTHTLMGGKVVYSRADYLALPFERRALLYLGAAGGGGCCLGW